MKIKSLGYASFLISAENLDIVTDPKISIDAGVKMNNIGADMIISSNEHSEVEVKPTNRSKPFFISKPGEYEVSEIMIQRPIGADYYIIDDDLVRIVYVAAHNAKLDVKSFQDLGDVDVLMLPVGDNGVFPDYDTIEKIISTVDPANLVPFAYNTGKVGANLKTLEDFVKHFGFNITEETTLKVESAAEAEDRKMNVVVLK